MKLEQERIFGNHVSLLLLWLLCAVLQIAGYFLLVYYYHNPQALWTIPLIAISGFAALIHLFIPEHPARKILALNILVIAASLTGLAIIVKTVLISSSVFQ